MTMVDLLAFGTMAGLLIGLAARSDKVGCIVLMFLPVFVVVCTAVEQQLYPERLNPFSGLDFASDPFWFTIGALGGFIGGRLIRILLGKE
jgi:hypothetical protein